MKLFRNLLLFLLFLAISALTLSFFAPTQQKVQKSILINAKPSVVYRQMMLLQNFNNWSVWGKADSSVKYTTEGKDGVVGAKVIWEGSQFISGKGEIILKELKPDELIRHDVNLLEPQPLNAGSTFELNPVGNQTEVKWTFVVPSKRPFNVFNIFYNLEKEKGGDFAAGLTALKLMIEKAPLKEAAVLPVRETRFPYTRYAAIRQTILWVDYPMFFEQHFAHLGNYVLKGHEAVKTGLIFDSDKKLSQGNIAAALPLPAGYKPQLNAPEQIIEIPASKSIEVVFKGKENIKQQVYKSLDKFLTDKKLKLKKPVIEQYLAEDTLPETKVIYLVE